MTTVTLEVEPKTLGIPQEIGEEFYTHINPDQTEGGLVSLGTATSGAMKAQVGEGVYIHPSVIVQADSKIGDGCEVHEGVSLARKVILGNSVIVAAGAKLREGASAGDEARILERAWVCRNTTVETGEIVPSDQILLRPRER